MITQTTRYDNRYSKPVERQHYTLDALMEKELDNENEYRQAGYELLQEALATSYRQGTACEETLLGKALLSHVAGKVYMRIAALVTQALCKGHSVNADYVLMLQQLADVLPKGDKIAQMLTVVTVSSILNRLVNIKDVAELNTVAGDVATRINQEYQLARAEQDIAELQTLDPTRAQTASDGLLGLRYRNRKDYKHKYLVATLGKSDLSLKPLPTAPLKGLAMHLIRMTQDLGLWTKVTVPNNGKSPLSGMQATPELADAIIRNEQALLAMAYKTMPMVVPPASWQGITGGGYIGVLGEFCSLLRIEGADGNVFARDYLARLEQLDISNVLSAVNALQATPWCINTEVLNTLIYCCNVLGWVPHGKQVVDDTVIGKWRARHTASVKVANHRLWLDRTDTKPLKDTYPATDEGDAEFRRDCVNWYAQERRLTSLVLRVKSILSMACRFNEYEQIFFPWNMDFRGRLYPIPSPFSPQADDLAKGLLLFADAPACTRESDIDWLKIALANLAGQDKKTYEERIAWVNNHHNDLLAVAAAPTDPDNITMWLETDSSPVELLAAIIEYGKAVKYMAEHNGSIVGWVTGLAYQQDGTCSGTQHYSAILRDEIAGATVNLVPQDKKSDIYGAVASKVLPILQRDAMQGTADTIKPNGNIKLGTQHMAQVWLTYGVDRSVAKYPTMTLCYGVTRRGMADQLYLKVVKPASEAGDTTFAVCAGSKPQLTTYLADILWEAIGETVRKAREAMDWLTDVAQRVVKESNVVSWITPNGLLVQQSYMCTNSIRHQLRYAGKRYSYYVTERTGKLDTKKQAAGIAPNFVHSLDASHMQMTVNAAHDAGIKHYLMIHDSYGCPIAQAGLMYDIVRDQFVRQYTEHDVLDELRTHLQPLVSDELPTPPAKGTLNISCVRASKYFVC